LKYKLDIRDRLNKLLQGSEVKIYVMQSTLLELEKVGAKAKSAKEFAVAYCEVIDDSGTTGETTAEHMVNYIGKVLFVRFLYGFLGLILVNYHIYCAI
jgi:rRNA-processing protein FCF1